MSRSHRCWAVLIVASVVAIRAAGQVTDEEYRKKLQEFQSRTSTRPTASEPGSTVAWKLKPGAPRAIVTWFEHIESMKTELVGQLWGEMIFLNDKNPRIARTRTLQDLRRAAELKVLVPAIRKDPYFIPFPPAMELQEGCVGTLEGMRLLQVVDDMNCIVTWGKHTLWMTNAVTRGHVDGQVFARQIAMVIGTKQYATIDGGSRTVFMIEPISIDLWLDNWPESYDPKGTEGIPWPGVIPRRPPAAPALPAPARVTAPEPLPVPPEGLPKGTRLTE